MREKLNFSQFRAAGNLYALIYSTHTQCNNTSTFANTLSLAHWMKEHRYQITYNSNDGNEFAVNKPNGSVRVFKQSERGLFYLNTQHVAKNVM